MFRCHLSHMMTEHKPRIAVVNRETGLSRDKVTLLCKETAQTVDLDTTEKIHLLFGSGKGDQLEVQEIAAERKESLDADH